MVVGRGVDHDRGSVRVQKRARAVPQSRARDMELDPAHAVRADLEIGQVAKMVALRVLGAVLPPGRVPMPACAREGRALATPDGVKMSAVAARGQPLRLQHDMGAVAHRGHACASQHPPVRRAKLGAAAGADSLEGAVTQARASAKSSQKLTSIVSIRPLNERYRWRLPCSRRPAPVPACRSLPTTARRSRPRRRDRCS